jgi:hypothetical protein
MATLEKAKAASCHETGLKVQCQLLCAQKEKLPFRIQSARTCGFTPLHLRDGKFYKEGTNPPGQRKWNTREDENF